MVTDGLSTAMKEVCKLAKKHKEVHTENVRIKSFVDMIAPSVIKFFPDYFICGNTFRSVWALREYPTTTEEQAILKHLGEKDGVTYGYKLLEEAHIPKIKNGYFMFEDRHYKSKDSKDDTELFDRYSFNFSIAIYDCDTDIMYYFEYDT